MTLYADRRDRGQSHPPAPISCRFAAASQPLFANVDT